MPRATPEIRRSGRRSSGIVFFLGLAVAVAGGVAFLYAHEHDPQLPGVDPMAVHLISNTAYERLHVGGIVAMAAGAFLMLAGLVTLVIYAEPS